MRKFKFRVWDKKENKLFYDISLVDHFLTLEGEILSFDQEGVFTIDYYILMHTGLKDKNGKEVYESDLVKVCVGGVEYIREVYQAESGAWSIKLPTLTDTQEIPFYLIFFDFEVIGNIYETPDLL